MLTGDLGADRIDYLLRDAYHAGQRSGTFDHDRLIREVKLIQAPQESPTSDQEPRAQTFLLGFGEGGWGVAEQMIAARYLMYTGLYFHKTKRICEIHLAQFMPSALESFGGHLPGNVQQYVALSDSQIWAQIIEAASVARHPMHVLASRFTERNHMRLSKEIILADNYRLTKGKRKVPDKNRFARLDKIVREKYGIEAVVGDSPDHSATKMFDIHNLLVSLDGQTRYLDEVSEIVGGMSSRIWRGRIYDDQKQRNEVHDFCNAWLRENPSQLAPEQP